MRSSSSLAAHARRACVFVACALVLVGPACVLETAGIEVATLLRVRALDPASTPADSLRLASGARLRSVDLSVTALELVSCGPAVSRGAAPQRRFARAIAGISFAHAHELGTPLKVTHGVMLALGPDAAGALSAFTLGAFTPPPGHYCALRVTFAPADPHVQNLARDLAGLVQSSARVVIEDPRAPTLRTLRTRASGQLTVAFDAPLTVRTPDDHPRVVLDVDAPGARARFARLVDSLAPEATELGTLAPLDGLVSITIEPTTPAETAGTTPDP